MLGVNVIFTHKTARADGVSTHSVVIYRVQDKEAAARTKQENTDKFITNLDKYKKILSEQNKFINEKFIIIQDRVKAVSDNYG